MEKFAVESPSLVMLKTREDEALYLKQPDLIWILAHLKQGFRLPRFFPT